MVVLNDESPQSDSLPKHGSFRDGTEISDVDGDVMAHTGVLKRSKRVDNRKKQECKQMEIGSMLAAGIADTASAASSAAASMSVFGSAAAITFASAAAIGYVQRTALNIAYINQDCDAIPFDEIKEVLEKRFNQVDKALDKNFRVLKEVSETVSKTLSTVEDTRSEMHQGFKDVLESVNNLKIEPIIAKLNNFIWYFESEKERIENLPRGKYITKLQETNDFLLYLGGARTPRGDSLRTPLHDIINHGYAIPQDANDKTAFTTLYSLYYGTQTYISVMFFLLKQHSYLADYHYQNGDITKYNEHFDLTQTCFDNFKHSLVDRTSSMPLIDNVIDVLRDVRNKAFVKSNKNLSEVLSQRIDSLSLIKSQLQGMELPDVIDDIPEALTAKPRFSKSLGISTPIGEWEDGVKVSYAMQFKNNGTYSKVGQWSKPFVVRGKACPSFNLPMDSKERTRLIFRRFNDGKPQLVGMIEDKHQPNFRDIDRDLYNAASRLNKDIAMEEAEILVRNGANINTVFDKGRRAIHTAAEGGNHELASRFLINNSTDINVRDGNSYTSMHIAAEAGHQEFIELLIDHGAEVNAKTSLGQLTPIHLAIRKGYLSAIEALLQSNATDVNLGDQEGFTPLHGAVFKGVPITQALISHNGTDVNAKSKEGLTPLHLLSINNHPETAQVLLQSDRLDLNSQANGNFTPMHFASMFGSLEMVKFLTAQNGTDVNAESIDSWTPLHFAVSRKKNAVVLELLNVTDVDIAKQTKEGLTALHLAAVHGNAESISPLMDHGADLEAKTATGSTPLHLAASSQLSNVATIENLLHKGANLNAINNSEETFLHLAARSGSLDTLKYFIGKNYSVNARDKNGKTPLHTAAVSNHLNIVKYLMENGANIGAKSYDGKTSLHYAASAGNLALVKYFFENGANVNAKDKDGETPLYTAAKNSHLVVVKYLVDESNADINAQNGDGQTILHFAVSADNLALVKYFSENGGDVNAKDKNGETALYTAAKNSHLDIVKYLVDESNADMNVRNSSGKTILHFAASTGNLALVKYFAEKGSDVNPKDDNGLAPLLYAAKNGHLDIVKYFIEERDVGLNAVCNFASRPLAAYYGHLDVVKYLFYKENGTNLAFINNFVTLFSAIQNGHLDIVTFLGAQERLDSNLNEDNSLFFYAYSLLIQKYHIEKKHADLSNIAKFYFTSFRIRFDNLGLTDGRVKLYIFLLSAENGHFGIAKYFIDKEQTDVNTKYVHGNTLLHHAAGNGYLDLVRYLVDEKHGDFGAENKDGMTPLLFAAKGNHLDVVKYLAEKGASLNSSNDRAPLLFAAANGNLDMVKYLMGSGAEIKAKSKGGNVTDLSSISSLFENEYTTTNSYYDSTPLCNAARNGHLGIFKYLAEKGADVNVKNEDGDAPLYIAVKHGHLGFVKYLLDDNYANINIRADKYSTLFDHAVAGGHSGMVRYLIEIGVGLSKDLLHVAAASGNLDLVKYAVEKGADVNAKNKNHHTPVYIAAKHGYLDIVKYLVDEKHANINNGDNYSTVLNHAVVGGHLGMVRYLIERGASPGKDILHVAAASGKLNIVRFIAGKWPDFVHVRIRQLFTDGLTPLHYAAEKGSLDIVKYLVDEKRTDVNVQDSYNWTPLHYAARGGHLDVVKYLMSEKRANPNIEGTDGKTPLICALSNNNTSVGMYIIEKFGYRICHGSNVNMCLSKASESGHLNLVKYLIRRGADVNLAYSSGLFVSTRIPLQNAMQNDHFDVVEYLIENGANVNAKFLGGFLSPQNLTSLHVAAANGNQSMVEFLVGKGADISATAGGDLTPLRLANLCCNTATANFLKSKGVSRNRRSIEYENLPRKSKTSRYNNDDISAVKNNEAASGTSKPSSWISAVGHTIVGAAVGISHIITSAFKPAIDMKQPSRTVTTQSTDVNGTLLLLDVFIRKISGQKYVTTEDQTTLSLPEAQCYASYILNGLEKILKDTAVKSGISVTNLNFDHMKLESLNMYVSKKLMTGQFFELSTILYSSAKQVCPEFEQTNKFLRHLESSMKMFLDKKASFFIGPERKPEGAKQICEGESYRRANFATVPLASISRSESQLPQKINEPETHLSCVTVYKQIKM